MEMAKTFGAPVNPGDMFKVFGTADNDNIIVGERGAVPRAPFEIASVEFLKVRGGDGF